MKGGCANSYTFGDGDPVNYPDLNGQFAFRCWLRRGLDAVAIVAGVASLFVAPEALAVVSLGAASVAYQLSNNAPALNQKVAGVSDLAALAGLAAARAAARRGEPSALLDFATKGLGVVGAVLGVVDLVRSIKHKC